jgi:hypothetical protein
VGVLMNLFEAGLVHVLMGVLGPVVVGVRVFVRDVLVFVCGVRVCVRDVAVPVFVRMWHVMAVLFAHDSFSSPGGMRASLRPSDPPALIALIRR